MQQVLQQKSAYHEGFYDAQQGAPLFDDAHPDYAAGWRAYWECRVLLTIQLHKIPSQPSISA